MLYAIVVALILIADQGLKYWVTLHLALNEGQVTLIPGVLELRNIHNSGVAFSWLQNAPSLIFVLIAVVFTVVVILALRRGWIHGAFGRWMAVLVVAGALGNCLDRLLSGYVVDMFSFPFWPSFAVFNLADVFITVGGILFCLHVIFYRGDRTAKADAAPEPETKTPAKADAAPAAAPDSRAKSPAAPEPEKPDLFAAWGGAAKKTEKTPEPAAKTAPKPEARARIPAV